MLRNLYTLEFKPSCTCTRSYRPSVAGQQTQLYSIPVNRYNIKGQTSLPTIIRPMTRYISTDTLPCLVHYVHLAIRSYDDRSLSIALSLSKCPPSGRPTKEYTSRSYRHPWVLNLLTGMDAVWRHFDHCTLTRPLWAVKLPFSCFSHSIAFSLCLPQK